MGQPGLWCFGCAILCRERGNVESIDGVAGEDVGYGGLHPGTVAEAALPSSKLEDNIYFDPKFVNKQPHGFVAAMLMHETIHTLGVIDDDLMTALNLDPKKNVSDNINKKLAKDCFGVKGDTVKY